jgi:ABC-type uncharacterized transport system permease subunit
MRYYNVALSGLLAACGGVYLSMGVLSAFTESKTTLEDGIGQRMVIP